MKLIKGRKYKMSSTDTILGEFLCIDDASTAHFLPTKDSIVWSSSYKKEHKRVTIAIDPNIGVKEVPTFTQPVSMPCTSRQFERDLRIPLVEMGYKINELITFGDSFCQNICNNFSGEIGVVDNIPNSNNLDNERYFIDHYNPGLFLSLAVMNESILGLPGEWYKFIAPQTCALTFMPGNIYQLIKFLDIREGFINEDGVPDGFFPGNEKVFQKATKEEIIEHFVPSKKERLIKELNLFMEQMSFAELKSIVDIMNIPEQKEEDKNAFVASFADNFWITDDVSRKLFGSESTMQIGTGAAEQIDRDDLVGRSLYFPDTVELIQHKTQQGTLLEIRKP